MAEQGERGDLTLHLLDSAQGHVIQSWTVTDHARITIGRAAENDISLADQRVSRFHVELIYRGEKWVLYSHGRNGTWINGVPVSESHLSNESIFQLGSSGPSLQVDTALGSTASKPTVDADPETLDFLNIDEQRTSDDVRQIAESDAFHNLQQQARRLKHADGCHIQEG